MHVLSFGITILLYVGLTFGQCDVSSCVHTGSSPFAFLSCSDYTRSVECMHTKLNQCTGTVGHMDMMLMMQTMHQPSDCDIDPARIGSSMTARTNLMTAVMNRVPRDMSAFPGMVPPMMGDDGPLDDMDDGFDDGPMGDGFPGPMFWPGLTSGTDSTATSSGGTASSGTLTSGHSVAGSAASAPARPGLISSNRPTAGRFVDNQRSSSGKISAEFILWMTPVIMLLTSLKP